MMPFDAGCWIPLEATADVLSSCSLHIVLQHAWCLVVELKTASWHPHVVVFSWHCLTTIVSSCRKSCRHLKRCSTMTCLHQTMRKRLQQLAILGGLTRVGEWIAPAESREVRHVTHVQVTMTIPRYDLGPPAGLSAIARLIVHLTPRAASQCVLASNSHLKS